MTYQVTATQARTISSTDQVVYNEVDVINRKIIEQALLGELQATIDDGTVMTESTPTITVVGTVSNPVAGVTPEALTIAGSGVSIPADSDVDQIVAAINDASITGLTASKNSTNNVVLTYTPSKATWSLAIGLDSANATVGLTEGNVVADTPSSVDYHATWSGTTEDRKKSYEMAQVIQHFQDAGYNILRKQHTDVAQTLFKWEVYW